MYTDELLIKQLTRIADALERIAYSRERPSVEMPKGKESLFGPNAFLTEVEAAEKLGVSKSFFSHKRLSGDGPPYVKVGRRVRYNAKELEQWCRSNTVAHSEWSSRRSQKRTEF